jgi:hypothetical protein
MFLVAAGHVQRSGSQRRQASASSAEARPGANPPVVATFVLWPASFRAFDSVWKISRAYAHGVGEVRGADRHDHEFLNATHKQPGEYLFTDHSDPLTELAQLERVGRERWVHYRRLMPRRDNPAGLTDSSTLEEHIARSIAEGYE